MSSAQYKIGIFRGDPEITALKLSEAASSVPGLALFDLLGTDDIIKSAEDGPLVAQEGIDTMVTTINNTNHVQVTSSIMFVRGARTIFGRRGDMEQRFRYCATFVQCEESLETLRCIRF